MSFSKIKSFSISNLRLLETFSRKFATTVLNVSKSVFTGVATAAVDVAISSLSSITTALVAGLSTISDGVIYILKVSQIVINFFDFMQEVFKPFFAIKKEGLGVAFGLTFYLRFVLFCSSLYDFFVSYFPVSVPVVAVPESYENLFAGLAFSALVPSHLKFLLRDLNLFSSFKLFDDTTILYDIFDVIFNVPVLIVNYLFPDGDLKSSILSFFDLIRCYFPLGSNGKVIYCARNLIDEYRKKNSVIGDLVFQDAFEENHCKMVTFVELMLRSRNRLPGILEGLYKQSCNVYNKIKYIKNNHRVEPVWCVFVGPPGTGKTMLMNKLVTSYSRTNTVYVHSCPGEKDFYDQYDNEYVFVVDDVGQKGVEQWSNFINMVSVVKFPLDCAVAEKKHTKFFTSPLIFSTTNNINLTITGNCGLSDLSALHRRMFLFNFNHVTFDGTYGGFLTVEKYSTPLKKFVVHQKIFMKDPNIYIEIIDRLIRAELLLKKSQFEEIQPVVLDALPQSGSSFVNMLSEFYSCIVQEVYKLVSGFSSSGGCGSGFHYLIYFWFVLVLICFYLVYSYYFQNHISVHDGVVKQLMVPLDRVSPPRLKKGLFSAIPESLQSIFSMKKEEISSPLLKLANQTYGVALDFINLQGVQVRNEFISVFSGRYFTGVHHGCLYDDRFPLYVTVFSTKLNVVYDHVEVKVVYVNESDDLKIFELPLCCPKYTRNLKFGVQSYNSNVSLVLPLNQLRCSKGIERSDFSIQYFKDNYGNLIDKNQSLLHEFNGESMCGAFLVTDDNFLVGHHVAFVDELAKGVVKIFTRSSIEAINFYFDQNVDYHVSIVRDEKIVGSVAYLQKKCVSIPVSKTTLVPSKVSGIFPHERMPADFGERPLKKMKELSKASHMVTQTADLRFLGFVENYIDTILEGFTPVVWNEDEIVTGGLKLNRIDPATSVGFGLNGCKKDYLDYDNSCYVEEFRKSVLNVEESISKGENPNEYFAEQFKDELRDLNKVEKPRIFKMCPLMYTVLGRKYFGEMMYFLFCNRKRNGIMIGINPFSKDWPELVEILAKVGKSTFDGDFEKWDKKMLSIFQQILNRCILKKYVCLDLKVQRIVEYLLFIVMMTPSICVDEVVVTTHSLPTGLWMTGYYNSLIHKCYMAYAFCFLYFEKFDNVPLIEIYCKNVVNVVYGDDGLNSVSDEFKELFNGPSVSRVMMLLGLGYTQGDKGVWSYSVRSVYECSFLKRGFSFHHELGEIVAPLSLKSVQSTLNFVRDGFRNDELTLEKLYNFQREAFLHCVQYDVLMRRVETFTTDHNVQFMPLTKNYLINLYREGQFVKMLEYY